MRVRFDSACARENFLRCNEHRVHRSNDKGNGLSEISLGTAGNRENFCRFARREYRVADGDARDRARDERHRVFNSRTCKQRAQLFGERVVGDVMLDCFADFTCEKNRNSPCMRSQCRTLDIEHTERDARACGFSNKRGISRKRYSCTGIPNDARYAGFWHGIERRMLHASHRIARSINRSAQSIATELSKLSHKRRELPPRTKFAPIGINDDEQHREMRRQQFSAEVLRRYLGSSDCRKMPREFCKQHTLAKLDRFHRALHHFFNRKESHAQVFRKRSNQRIDLLRKQSRHQPLEGLRIDKRERFDRNARTHTIARVFGIMRVDERNRERVERDFLRILRRVGSLCAVFQKIFVAHQERVLVLRFSIFSPRLERWKRTNIRGDACVVELERARLLKKLTASSAAFFLFLKLRAQRTVVLKKRTLCSRAVRYKPFVNKDSARRYWIDWPPRHAMLRNEHEFTATRALPCGDLPSFLDKMRLKLRLRTNVRRNANNPIGLDACANPRVASRRLDEFRCDHPIRSASREDS